MEVIGIPRESAIVESVLLDVGVKSPRQRIPDNYWLPWQLFERGFVMANMLQEGLTQCDFIWPSSSQNSKLGQQLQSSSRPLAGMESQRRR